ncbi:MAG: hypothetical protein GY759_18350 [Chloroflexi bacterium]|nr:hypothetical protein [Chloroflexota bacterium]
MLGDAGLDEFFWDICIRTSLRSIFSGDYSDVIAKGAICNEAILAMAE